MDLLDLLVVPIWFMPFYLLPVLVFYYQAVGGKVRPSIMFMTYFFLQIVICAAASYLFS